MAGTLLQAEFTYQSGTTTETYQFTIVYEPTGRVYVRDVQNGYGLIVDAYSRIPSSVTADISTAIAQVENIMANTSSVNGTLAFSSENYKNVTFAVALADTAYRVQLTSDTFVPLRITSKTVTGFQVQAGATFTGNVGYDVFV